MSWKMRTVDFLLALAMALPLAAAPRSGGLLGVVVAEETPQLGATVTVVPEQVRGSGPLQLLTNERGLFRTKSLYPGLYSVRVTLAGFLPAMEQHIRIQPRQTTLLKVQLDSVFSSIDRLRRHPHQKLDADEWSWVLRTSAATRPVLRWTDGQVVLDQDATAAGEANSQRPHGRMELTTGARRPGSVSNLASSPATAFAYEQGIGSVSRLLLAGQVSYEHTTTEGFGAIWLPSGEADKGPVTTLVLRQAKLGPQGPIFRGMRLNQDDQLAFGDHATLRYGVEYVLVGLGRSTSSLRPHAELGVAVSPNWQASLSVASAPQLDPDEMTSSLESALDELDSFPTFLVRNGRPVFERGWHEELAVRHPLGTNSTVVAAVFRDHSTHTAVFGRGNVANPDFFQDFFSDGFTYDGGNLSQWGTRLAFQQKISDDLEATLVYSWSGAWTLAEEQPAPAANMDHMDLRDALQQRYRHSLAARVSSRFPRWGTQLAASYQWSSGQVVTRPDPFGDALYKVEPFLNVSLRQPLPDFFCCHIEALADFRNLFAQGYIPVSIPDGRVLLIPAFRSFRGGFSVQF